MPAPKQHPAPKPSRSPRGFETRPPRSKRKPKPAPASAPPPQNPFLELQPLTDRGRLFIEHILLYHDVDAMLNLEPSPCSLFEPWTAKECKTLQAMPEIQRAIRERRHRQEVFNARSALTARELTPEFLKASLVRSIKKSEGVAQMTGIEMGFVVTGVVAKGQLIVPVEQTSAPNIYRALQTTTMQRVTETITQTKEIPAADNRALPPPTLEAEILDY